MKASAYVINNFSVAIIPVPLIFTQTVDRSSCASVCPTKSDALLHGNKFHYEVGKAYEYDYAAETVTAMRGTSDQESRVLVRAKAEVTVRDRCDFELKVHTIHRLNNALSQ